MSNDALVQLARRVEPLLDDPTFPYPVGALGVHGNINYGIVTVFVYHETRGWAYVETLVSWDMALDDEAALPFLTLIREGVVESVAMLLETAC